MSKKFSLLISKKIIAELKTLNRRQFTSKRGLIDRLREELSAQAGREATVSSIYITLTRLEAKGMVRSWMGEPTQVRGGKARRFFQVEARGLAALNQARDRLLAMWEGVQTASEGSGG